MDQPVYKVDHHYNPSPAWVSEFSKARMEKTSFRNETEKKLNQWRTIQNKKQEIPTIDFERIMEEDLGRQAKALEFKEKRSMFEKHIQEKAMELKAKTYRVHRTKKI